MQTPVARIGDHAVSSEGDEPCTSCGASHFGPATKGSPDVLAHGKAILRVGDTGGCPHCGNAKDAWNAARGASRILVNGKHLVRENDLILHNATKGRIDKTKTEVLVLAGDWDKGKQIQYGIKFQLFYQDTGIPVNGRKYQLARADGTSIISKTNMEGMTELVRGDRAETVVLTVYSTDFQRTDIALTKSALMTELKTLQPLVVSLPSRCRLILTFDDGPADEAGPKYSALQSILDTLKSKGDIKACFYFRGDEVAQLSKDIDNQKATNDEKQHLRSLIDRLVEAGHVVGNHSYNHVDITKLTDNKLRESINSTQTVISRIFGLQPKRFRPPYGTGRGNAKVKQIIGESGLILTFWDVDTNDWRNPLGLKDTKFNPSMKQWADNYKRKGHPLDVLMHVLETTARDLPYFIDEWRAKWDCSFALYDD